MRLTSPAADLPRESRRRDTFLCRSAVSKQLHPLTSQRPSGAAASDQRGSPTASFPAEVGVPPKRRRRHCEHSTWLRFEAIPSF